MIIIDVNRFGVLLIWELLEYDGGVEIINYIIELRDKIFIRWDIVMIVKVEDLFVIVIDVVEG